MDLESLEITPACTLIGQIVTDRATGLLTVVSTDARRELYWSQGDLVLATSTHKDESLVAFLEKKEGVARHLSEALSRGDPVGIVQKFFDLELVPSSRKQAVLREWTETIALTVFTLDEGSAAFSAGEALEPEKRVFIPFTASLVLEGIRRTQNGLILRRGIGDASRLIRRAREPRFSITQLPLSPDEQRVQSGLTTPCTIQELLKKYPGESAIAAKTVISMLALGVFEIFDPSSERRDTDSLDQSERDLALMVAIGPSDQRSLRAVGFARQMDHLDYYRLLDLPRAATRAQIETAYENARKNFDPMSYPLAARETTQRIVARLEQAHSILANPVHRAEYDQLIAKGGVADTEAVNRMIVRRSIAHQNLTRARDLITTGDYYGAIMLLRQTVRYVPDSSEGWFMLGSCQMRNPNQKWQREAMESLQRSIAADPNNLDAILALGDLYRSGGLKTRAKACYEDVLSINPEHGEAKVRLQTLK